MNTQEVAAIARPESWLRSASGIVVPDDLRLFDFEPDDYAWVAMCIDCALHFGVCSTAILDVINTHDNEDVWDRSMQWIADEIELRGGKPGIAFEVLLDADLGDRVGELVGERGVEHVGAAAAAPASLCTEPALAPAL